VVLALIGELIIPPTLGSGHARLVCIRCHSTTAYQMQTHWKTLRHGLSDLVDGAQSCLLSTLSLVFLGNPYWWSQGGRSSERTERQWWRGGVVGWFSSLEGKLQL
jgi:hypothetical protein